MQEVPYAEDRASEEANSGTKVGQLQSPYEHIDLRSPQGKHELEGGVSLSHSRSAPRLELEEEPGIIGDTQEHHRQEHPDLFLARG